MYSPPSSPISPRSSKPPMPKGFRSAPTPKERPLSELSIRELHDRRDLNERLLFQAQQMPTSSTYIDRITADQAAIDAHLVERIGVEDIRVGMKKATIDEYEDMAIDSEPQKPQPVQLISAKQRALARYRPMGGSSAVGSMDFEEAVAIEQRAHAADRERQERIDSKKRRLGLPIPGEVMTREEREKRLWAFINHKPTDSDIEDDSDWDEDSDDDDPASWFVDDEEDGRKGQDIVEPDVEEWGEIVRIQDRGGAGGYSSFYEPRDDDE